MTQPPPTPNDAPPIHESVIADIRERAEAGRAQCGTYLQPHNGRDWYEELLDAAQYARQAMAERDAMVDVLNDLHDRVHSDICGKRCCSECVAYQKLMENAK